MKVLHVAVHLGGGVGRAHAAMAPHFPAEVKQTFALLADPIDRRAVDAIEANGGGVVTGVTRGEVASLARDADIVQIEYWGHPALEGFFDGWTGMFCRPSVCWCHVSGLFAPFIPAPMMLLDRFVSTSPITVHPEARFINSGFGFEPIRERQLLGAPRVAYLGTVDFKKLHSEFFTAVDTLGHRVDIWGHVSRDARETQAAMRRPELARLHGHTLDPRAALAQADILFYPLRRDHYGTAENALVEAMSLGVVPVVLDNPAEANIVKDSYTGLIAGSIEGAIAAVDRLMRSPGLRRKFSGNAMRDVARTRAPETSAKQFVALWTEMLAEQRQDIRAFA